MIFPVNMKILEVYVSTVFILQIESSCASTIGNNRPITKTCPCNVYPLEPHFYIAQLGYAGVYLFFLFLLQNIDCGYSTASPRRL